MNTRAITILAASVLVAACGGGSDESSDTAPATAAETTLPETTVPETTLPETTVPETTLPETTTPTTAAPTTEPPDTEPDTALEFGPFCDASQEYYVTSLAIFNYVNSNAGAEVLFGFAIDEADVAIDAAPTPEFAAEPSAARDALVELSDALTPIGFDVDLADPDLISGPITTLTQINGALETFIADGCDADLTALDDRARSLAIGIDAQYPDPDSDGDDGDNDGDDGDDGDAATPIDITDDTGILSATVPGNWGEVRGAPDGDVRQLVAAENIDAFLASFNIPGMVLISGDADDASASLALARDGVRSGAEADGCTVSISAPYDDGVYTGQEDFLECPGGDAVFHLIGGTNASNDVWFVMGLVVEMGDTTTRDLVGESFFVD